MGSKYRLLPWIHGVLHAIPFRSAVDAFSGSGCVSYLLKAMGKRVVANDLLNFPSVVARATIENSGSTITPDLLSRLLRAHEPPERFIEETFAGIFFTRDDLRFLDQVSWSLEAVGDPYARSVALSALVRSCVKRQPRGVFTVAGDPAHYKDGRRDVRLSLREHFVEQVEAYNRCVFDNGERSRAVRGDVFDLGPVRADLVYMDPPYVPRSDDNCYMKRYHFLEGLSCYWRGLSIMQDTRVKKVAKPFTPFSYRRTAIAAFERLFRQFRRSILVLSYSSNGYPDLDVLVKLMKVAKGRVEVLQRDHRYHFGTHESVRRAQVREYLVVGH
jgi:DNA adenine methylase/adenine-specific DNA-methyltransferase